MSWHLKRFTRDMIDEIVRNPGNYDTQDIRRAAKEAEYHYLDGTYGCDIEWMTLVQLKLNEVLRSRGESPI
ncbi:MAG: hypothetical protein IJX01_05945 [Oscillospiraceae bacterium]|nr:hypothetical protein [Oscillospiraceae bacterium]